MMCDEVKALAPELALNLASGEQRAAALGHVARCPSCRREVEAMSEVADAILLLAPPAEPPPGFESRVLSRLPAARRRPWRRVLAVAAAVVLTAALSSGLTYAMGAHDRHLAAEQREQQAGLAAVDGRYFAAAPLLGEGGRQGQVFGYAGRPSWVYVVAGSGMSGDVYTVDVVTSAGRKVPLGSMQVWDGRRAWGALLPFDLSRVASVQLVSGSGTTYSAQLHP